jgi:murein DD-endopeptidase MepM/ murein hydrolase activator NlpD
VEVSPGIEKGLDYNDAMSPAELVAVLERYRRHMAPVLDFDITSGEAMVFDFTAGNSELAQLDINDVAGFTEYLFEQIAAADPPIGIGRYNEDRVLYRHSPLFDGTAERRSVHLGIDLFVAEGTTIFAPLRGRIFSFADNARLGDYGPTVILDHELDGVHFYTLYGHLSCTTLDGIQIGAVLDAGDVLGEVGDVHENGGWPPHLHFQVVREMPGPQGDFPGVAAPSEREHFLALCPDPNLILGIPGL